VAGLPGLGGADLHPYRGLLHQRLAAEGLDATLLAQLLSGQADLDDLDAVRVEYNTIWLHPGIGDITKTQIHLSLDL
jgi:hypothetical protein